MTEKMDQDMRRATEFILRVKAVYTLADIRRMDFVTYFKVLDECEQSAQEEIARMEKMNAGQP